MRIRVEHETRYRFSRPVFLEPQLVRLKPRSDAGQVLECFSLETSPAPSGQCEIIDASGNPAIWLWFEGLTEEFTLFSRSTVRTLRANPFDYLLEPQAFTIPLDLSRPERDALTPHLRPEENTAVRGLTRELALEAQHGTLPFLSKLNDWIYRNITVAPRQDPGIRTAAETLACGQGACRDATILFMAACREAGIPARYVSGYQVGDADQADRDLHAYPEAYLPGAGWRGYDPTLGLVVADSHLALCAAHAPELTAPVTGGFRGSATSSLIHGIALNVLE